MTDKLRQAAEMALEALENHSGNYKLSKAECVQHNAVVDALRQALAEPDTGIDRGAWSGVPDATKWVDELRGDEVSEILKQSEREGWRYAKECESEIKRLQELYGKTEQLEAETKRLQEREWVSLTDEDIEELRRNGAHSVRDADFRAIETRLKEKNT